MPSKLDRLLQSIDPARTLEEVDRRADDAINTFVTNGGQITEWNAFRASLIRFIEHLDAQILRLSAPVSMGAR